jgi:hypothetical protein
MAAGERRAAQAGDQREHQVAELELKPWERGRVDQRVMTARCALDPDKITQPQVAATA